MDYPDNVDDEQQQAMMAQALGFASFGAQPNPNKKRKYNPHADAAVVAQPSRPAAVPAVASTGSNTVPVGERTPRQRAPQANEAEIDLGEEDDGAGEGTDPAPTDPAPAADASAQGRIDDAAAQARHAAAGLPARPAPGTAFVGSSNQHAAAATEPRNTSAGGPRRDPQRPWYEGYYDRGSNENPWQRLEKAKRLSSLASWPQATAT